LSVMETWRRLGLYEHEFKWQKLSNAWHRITALIKLKHIQRKMEVEQIVRSGTPYVRDT